MEYGLAIGLLGRVNLTLEDVIHCRPCAAVAILQSDNCLLDLIVDELVFDRDGFGQRRVGKELPAMIEQWRPRLELLAKVITEELNGRDLRNAGKTRERDRPIDIEPSLARGCLD